MNSLQKQKSEMEISFPSKRRGGRAMGRMPQITRDPNHSIQHVKTINGSDKNTVQAPFDGKVES